MVLKYKDIHSFDNYKTMKIIYSMYRAGEVSVHRACCERATQSKKISNDQELIQSDPTSSPQNQKGNN